MKKLSYLYEIPIFYAFLIAINYVFLPEVPGYIDISPHPYWLGILLFGFRYGVFSGLTAGFVSAGLYLGFHWFFWERYVFEDLTFYLLPALFIIIGALVGFGVNRYLTAIVEKARQIKILQETKDLLLEDLNVQREITANLEKRITTKMATLVTLYQGAMAMDTINPTDLYDAILDFLSRTLPARTASLYLKSEEGWRLHKTYGRGEKSLPTPFYPFHQGLVGMAGSKEKIITIRDYLGGESFEKKKGAPDGSECLIAGPLRKGERGPVIAVYAVQDMDLLHLTSATTNLLSFLLNWADRSLGKAFYFEELKSQEILDPEYNIYSYAYFQSRFNQEFIRSRTYYLPLTIGLVRIKGLSGIAPDRRNAVYLAISRLLKESCRQTDIIARYPDPEIAFILLLTTTSESQSQEIKKVIDANFKKIGLKQNIQLVLGLSSYTPRVTSTENLIEEALKDLDRAA